MRRSRPRCSSIREGLAKGVPGPNHLAWQVEVGDGAGVREFVYVDAHTGKFIDQITGVYDGLNRRAYDGRNLPTPPPELSRHSRSGWKAKPFPTAVTEANNMIISSKETYDFYKNAFGRDSFDGAGATMDAIFNRGYSCPNASWNGTFISFCPGLTTDDVTGHEWSHAYTQYTHGLIYQWQPGALNESYSDIFGETIDRINGRGGDTPDNPRTADSLLRRSTAARRLRPLTDHRRQRGRQLLLPGLRRSSRRRPVTVGPTRRIGDVGAAPASACAPVAGVAGKIAIVDWTLAATGGNECGSGIRAAECSRRRRDRHHLRGSRLRHPQPGGASDVTIAMRRGHATTDGATIKARPAGDGQRHVHAVGIGTDNSVRWLLGEDDTAVGLVRRPARHVEPSLLGNPGKVTDTFEYVCSTADQGGVHTNSGVPNHAYALLVDGGTYNGQTISGIGLTKAAHIYFRAMSVYQGPASDFADHADALEQSCADLVGVEPGRPRDRRAFGPDHHRHRLRPGGQGRARRRAADPAHPVQLPAAAGQEPARPLRGGNGPGQHLLRQLREPAGRLDRDPRGLDAGLHPA